MVVARGWREGGMFKEYGVSVLQDEKRCGDSGNNARTLRMHLIPLNRTLKNG